jgi:hypothetical protein
MLLIPCDTERSMVSGIHRVFLLFEKIGEMEKNQQYMFGVLLQIA